MDNNIVLSVLKGEGEFDEAIGLISWTCLAN